MCCVFLHRVLYAFSHPQPAVNSADLAQCLSLNNGRYLCRLLSMSTLKPTQHYELPVYTPERVKLHPTRLPSSSSPPNLRSCLRKNSTGVNKKHVVFADDMGKKLTEVRLYTRESFTFSDQVKGPPLDRFEDQQSSSNNPLWTNLQLGLPQPTQDFTRLRNKRIHVESYNVSKNTLTGTVCAMKRATKAVCIRVTFDSWKTYNDIPCTFLKYEQGLDIFSFEVSLPQNKDPNEQTEFFLFCTVPGFAPVCDNNKGQNYKVCMEKNESNPSQGCANRFYSTLSKYRPNACPQASMCVKRD